MNTKMKTATLEEVADLMMTAETLESVDLGYGIIHRVRHPEQGELYVVSGVGMVGAIAGVG